ncbi:MAG TPA: GNAT family protein [Caulobacteraceae bacterium]|jgi:RimJ/RimL family protein N-acetyltransferase
MSIHGKRVVLRAIEEADLPLLHQWANDPEIWSNLGGWRFPSSYDSIRHWFSGLKNDQLNHRWAIETREDRQVIGTANLVDIDWKNNHAFHGMMLGPMDLRGKGYGLDTVMTVMRYAFDELHLERLDGDIIEYNEASHRLYVGKCGWKEEGRLRRWHFRKGRYWDKVVVGVTRDDYAELVRANGYWSVA